MELWQQKMAAALGMENFLLDDQRQALTSAMDGEAVHAGYVRGYVVRRVVNGEPLTIVSSIGDEGGSPVYIPADDDSHHNALVASLYAAQLASMAADDES